MDKFKKRVALTILGISTLIAGSTVGNTYLNSGLGIKPFKVKKTEYVCVKGDGDDV